MDKVTLTLELTYKEAADVLALLNSSTTANNQPEPKPVVTPLPKPGGRKGVKMPAFGRSQDQIDAQAADQIAKVTEQDAKAEAKAAKKEEQALNEKALQDEIASIKSNEPAEEAITLQKPIWML